MAHQLLVGEGRATMNITNDSTVDWLSGETLTVSPVAIELLITDSDVCRELEALPDSRVRTDYVLDALKVGVVALRQVRGQLEADRLKREGEHLLDSLRASLAIHQRQVAEDLSAGLKEYFAPDSGRLTERIERLVKRDGELEQLLRRQVSGDGSELARTLTAHLGEGSPLASLFDPSSPEGFLSTLNMALGDELTAQREKIMGEFSLDNAQGALSRLVAELSERHGELGQDLETRIDKVVAEFSLDDEDSALSRLVSRVERAQSQISQEFSLDHEQSALARIRRELLRIIESERDSRERFQREVLEKLASMVATRQEVARSPRHGCDFESHVFDLLHSRSQDAGHVATRVGNTTGVIKHCKVGDVLIVLGPEHAAAGAKVVVEAKEQEGFGLDDALAEIEKARKNRESAIGLFVFSSRTAPTGLRPFSRYGDDVLVIWNEDDPGTDVLLDAGLSVATALCTRAAAQREAKSADFAAIEIAIREIERQISGLDEITTFTGTIKSNSEKILRRASLMRSSLEDQVSALDNHVRDLKDQWSGGVL
jgi:hypothetical protein